MSPCQLPRLGGLGNLIFSIFRQTHFLDHFFPQLTAVGVPIILSPIVVKPLALVCVSILISRSHKDFKSETGVDWDESVSIVVNV